MRYAGSGVGHYQVPLDDTRLQDHPTTDDAPDLSTDPDEDEPASLTSEELRRDAEAAGETFVETTPDDDPSLVEEDEELALLEEEEDADGDVIDGEDLGAEDGEDGFEDEEEAEGYATL